MVDPAEDIRQRTMGTLNSLVSHNSLPADTEAWSREESWQQTSSIGLELSTELSLLQRLAGKFLLGGLGTGPTVINMFSSRFRQPPGTRGNPSWIHPTGGQRIAQKISLTRDLLI